MIHSLEFLSVDVAREFVPYMSHRSNFDTFAEAGARTTARRYKGSVAPALSRFGAR